MTYKETKTDDGNATAMLFILVCGGAFLWGVSNVVKKYCLDNLGIHEDLMTVGTMLGTFVFCLAAELFWTGLPRVSSNFWYPFIITALLNIGIQYGQVKAFKLEKAAIVAPLSSTMPMFVVWMSWILLKEWPTYYGLSGILAVSVGAYFLYLKGVEVDFPLFLDKVVPINMQGSVLFYGAPIFRLLNSKGARIALGTAYLGAVAVNYDKPATLYSDPMIFTGGVSLVVAGSVYLWSKIMRRWSGVDKRFYKSVFVLGLLEGLIDVLMNAGYYYGIVPYVGALKRTHILWTAVFASIFLKEGYTGLRIFGSLIIFIGAVLMIF